MNRCLWATAVLPLALASFAYPSVCRGATVNLPEDAAFPADKATNSGFTIRTSQASTNFVVGNNLLRAIKQLDGTLTDAANNTITNVAIPGLEPDGAYVRDTVNFERDAASTEVLDDTQTPVAVFI